MERSERLVSAAILAIASALPCAAALSSMRRDVRKEAAVVISAPEQDAKTLPPLPEFSPEPEERLPDPDASLQRLMNDINIATGGERATY